MSLTTMCIGVDNVNCDDDNYDQSFSAFELTGSCILPHSGTFHLLAISAAADSQDHLDYAPSPEFV